MRYQLCEGKGAKLCDTCARCVDNAPPELVERAWQLLRADGDDERCRMWVDDRRTEWERG